MFHNLKEDCFFYARSRRAHNASSLFSLRSTSFLSVSTRRKNHSQNKRRFQAFQEYVAYDSFARLFSHSLPLSRRRTFVGRLSCVLHTSCPTFILSVPISLLPQPQQTFLFIFPPTSLEFHAFQYPLRVFLTPCGSRLFFDLWFVMRLPWLVLVPWSTRHVYPTTGFAKVRYSCFSVLDVSTSVCCQSIEIVVSLFVALTSPLECGVRLRKTAWNKVINKQTMQCQRQRRKGTIRWWFENIQRLLQFLRCYFMLPY